MSNLENFLNKEVEVVVDRALGSKHPKFNYIYPINYGYLPNTISGDKEEIDAYILGEFKPLKRFRGVVLPLLKG